MKSSAIKNDSKHWKICKRKMFADLLDAESYEGVKIIFIPSKEE